MSLPNREVDSVPVSIGKSDANQTTTWDGTYVSMNVINPGYYYEIAMSWVAYQVALGSASLWTRATVRASIDDISFFPFFYEHFKGDYTISFQGFISYGKGGGQNKQAQSWNAGNETFHNIRISTDWSVDHEFGIQCRNDQTQCVFLIDGAVVATNTTNIAGQPFQIESAEINGGTGTLYEKFPPGIRLP